jgi:Zn-dependent protease with chaperone function
MSFLLMVFLTVVCLFPGYPRPPWGGSPALSAALTGLVVVLLGGHAFVVSRRVSRPLVRDPGLRDALLSRYERWRFGHQLAVCAAYVLALALLGWGWAVKELLSTGGRGGHGTEMLILLPFFAAQLLTWLFFYDADRAAHRAAHHLLDAEPFAPAWLETRAAAVPVEAPPFGGRWTYLAFQARQKLALVLLPVLLLILLKELERFVPSGQREWQLVVNGVGILVLVAVFLGMPWLIRLVLGLKPLPAGPLRDRLLASAARLRFRCSDILLWNTRSGMANALVIGIIPWVRYVVLTDRLLEEFTEEETEAVFGHEMGHIRHAHMPYYLAFLTLSLGVLSLVADHYVLGALGWLVDAVVRLFSPSAASEVAALLGSGSDWAVFPVVALILAYVFVVFGFLSRRCERQADVFGCRAVSCRRQDCRGHGLETDLADRGDGLCPTGILTFIRALEKVALVNGISRCRPGFLQSWQHSTIARRVSFLQSMLADPRAEPVFQRRLRLVKWGLLLGLAAAFVALVGRHGW